MAEEKGMLNKLKEHKECQKQEKTKLEALQRAFKVKNKMKKRERAMIRKIAVKADEADEVSREIEEYARRKIKSWKELVGTETDISVCTELLGMTLRELIECEHADRDWLAEHPDANWLAADAMSYYGLCFWKLESPTAYIYLNPCFWLLSSQPRNLSLLGHEFAHAVAYHSEGEADSIGKELALYEFRLGNIGMQLPLFPKKSQITEFELWVKNNG